MEEILIVSFLIIASYTDLKTRTIPNIFTYSLIGFGLVWRIFYFEPTVLQLALVVYFVGFILYKKGFVGGGDVKMYTGFTLILPFYSGFFFPLLLFIVSSIPSLGFVLALKVWQRIKRQQSTVFLKTKLPHAPFALIAAILVFWFNGLGLNTFLLT